MQGPPDRGRGRGKGPHNRSNINIRGNKSKVTQADVEAYVRAKAIEFPALG